MKHRTLNAFREHLNAVLDNKNTADTYYFAVDRLFADVQFKSLSEIPRERIEELLSEPQTKNRFSAARNGLKHLKSFDSSLNIPSDKFFKETATGKRNRRVKPAKTIELDRVHRKVNAVRDNKLKLAFRLMMKSGLRVSETAALEKRDIEIGGDIIKIDVKHGKGGSNDVVTCMEDKWLAGKLAEFIEPLNSEEKPFYAAQTMKNKANKLGLECHDFRRIAAFTRRDELKGEGMELTDANAETQNFLRHARFSVTKRYLQNRRLKFIKKPHRKQKNLTKTTLSGIIKNNEEKQI